MGSFLPGELELIDRLMRAGTRSGKRCECLRTWGWLSDSAVEHSGVIDRGGACLCPNGALASELFSYPDSSQFRLLTDDRIKADKSLARELGCQVGDEWVQISGPRTLGSEGMPICWANVYVIPEYGSIAQRLGGSSRPVYEMIAETFKESIENITVRLTAGVLSAQKAETLGVEEGTPSLSVSRFYQGRGGRVFEVSISEHPASNFNYTFEVTRGGQTADHWSWSN